ncbi:MAG: preprotein translocase subunit YajC, partial [Phycisphaerales bacterium]|nr:preprotein translocase subunit YajC [Phycisphaerales bacterium]MCI0674272.1 preprotein translocase subunit YajC [Phycisphaerales bacterium]
MDEIAVDWMWPLMLAQESATPPVPGAMPGEPGVPAGGTTAAPGNAAPGAGPGGSGGGSAPPTGFGQEIWLIMLLLLGGMIIFSIMGQRRDRKKREAMISAIKKHDKVQTIGGVIGSVVDIKPEFVVLKVDESSNTRITFARSAVQQV